MSNPPSTSYLSITCRCGHTADFDEFTRTPISGNLPRGQYQCPACHYAWRMSPQDTGTYYESGLYIPPTVKAEAVPAQL